MPSNSETEAFDADDLDWIKTHQTHEGRAAWITLNRPEKMNALSDQLLEELDIAFDRARSIDGLKGIVLTGSGDAFSAGYDLTPPTSEDEGDAYEGNVSDIDPTAYHDLRYEENQINLMLKIWDFPLPVIGAINGYALAGGFELSQMVDIVIVSESAEVGYPITRGTGTPPLFFLPFVVPSRVAREMLITGRVITGEEVKEIGLANSVVPDEDLTQEVNNYLDHIMKAPSDLLYLNKRQMNRTMDLMGYTSAIQRGHELHILGHEAPSVKKFHEMRKERGLQDALKWRNESEKNF
jgi:enoyl-CoA hydratase/carnithine racemase